MVMRGRHPSKPADASKLGLTSGMWKAIEDCWNRKRDKRPEIQKVASRLRKPWWVDFNLPLRLLCARTEHVFVRFDNVHRASRRVGYAPDPNVTPGLLIVNGNIFKKLYVPLSRTHQFNAH